MRKRKTQVNYFQNILKLQAASNFGCEYLHSRLSQQFLNIGGDIKWLEFGLEVVDNPKLQALANFNSKLAYHPSEVCKNPQMIEELIEVGWQKNELVMALFIITFYHGLACACQAFGLKSELDLRNSHISLLSKTQTPIGSNLQSPRNRNSDDLFMNKKQSFEFANNEIEKMLKKMTSQEEELSNIDDDQIFMDKIPDQKKKMSSSILKEKEDVSSPAVKDQKQQEENETKILQLRLFEKFKKFISNPELRDKDERIAQTLRYSDFNYQTHGFQIANQYTQEIAQASKNVFEIIKTMTNKKQNNQNILYQFYYNKSLIYLFLKIKKKIQQKNYRLIQIQTLKQRDKIIYKFNYQININNKYFQSKNIALIALKTQVQLHLERQQNFIFKIFLDTHILMQTIKLKQINYNPYQFNQHECIIANSFKDCSQVDSKETI